MKTVSDCNAPLHPKAIEGIRLFNQGKYFDAHEELEEAWREEKGAVRDLYQGILQVAVTYLHITRGNYAGAVKVYERSKKWLRDWPASCRGIDVGKLRDDAQNVITSMQELGKEQMDKFDLSLLRPIQWDEKRKARTYICDRCGHEMHEKNCKVTCPNCGNRFDCSDLNIYFD